MAANGSGAWQTANLGDVIELFDYKRVPLNSGDRQQRPGQYPYYGAQGIIDHIDDYIFDGRYILVAEDGENLNSKKLPLALFADGKFWVNNHAHILRAKEGVADDTFLLACLNNADIRPFVTGAAQPKLSQANLRQIEIPLPPLPVQRRIAGIVSAYDELMENNRRRIRLLETMARALYRELFVRPCQAGNLPKGWETKRLSELFEFIGGSQPPKIEHVYEGRPGYVRFVQNRDFGSASHLTYIRESRRNKLCDRLDIMVDKYGEPGTTRFGIAGAYNVALAKLHPYKPHYREWLRRLVSEPEFNQYLVGASQAATRASLNSSHFNMDVAVPPDEILRWFQERAEPFLKLTLTLQDSNANLRRTRDLLLPRLLSGQVELGKDEF